MSYYSVPLHLQPVFSDLSYNAGEFPIVERIANQCLSLPMSPYLSLQDQEQVICGVLGKICITLNLEPAFFLKRFSMTIYA